MHAAIQNLDDDLAGIRTGRATPAAGGKTARLSITGRRRP